MKKLIISIILLLFHNSSFSNEIVYLDIQYIIDNSDIGKFYKKKIDEKKKENNFKLKTTEEKIKVERNNIDNQKNILKDEEVNKKINELNNMIKSYQKERIKLNKTIIEEKKKYTSKILETLNPLLTTYVEQKKINLVVDKKNILVGIKTLDITNNILEILNNEVKINNLLNAE